MPNKILFVATVDSHFEKFHLPYFKWFQSQGWEVHVAASGSLTLPYVNQKYDISIQRSPFHHKNIIAYHALNKLIKQQHYRIIHCHTPMGGVLGRLAAIQARKKDTKVFYTAHGFHFYRGAPLLNWLLYYPIERTLARFTDCLITINEEDYRIARQHRFSAKQIEHVHGIGVDLQRFKPISEQQKNETRAKLGFNSNDFLMFYAAEFNQNKNQQLLIRTLALLQEHIPNSKLLLAGNGPLEQRCRELSRQLGVSENVHYIGYRNDIHKWLPICDIAVASSYREGLPVNIVEAMACELPVVASNNRGHCELIKANVNGYTVDPLDFNGMFEKILLIYQSSELQRKMGESNRQKAYKYSLNQVEQQLTMLYLMYGMEVWNETKNQYRSAHI